MRPDAKKHNPDPLYLRELIARTGMSQRQCAAQIGISDRNMRAHLSIAGKLAPAPYLVQFALESLADDCQRNVIP